MLRSHFIQTEIRMAKDAPEAPLGAATLMGIERLRGWGAWRQGARGALLLLMALLSLAAEAQIPSITLADDDGPISKLEIGRSLWVSGSDFGSSRDVVLVLWDDHGWPVARAQAVTDIDGNFEPTLVWETTGIMGCDCRANLGPYLYSRFEDALGALVGESFKVEILEAGLVSAASMRIPVVAPKARIAFPTDGGGCPRFEFGDDEDIYLRILGGRYGEIVDITLGESGEVPPREIRRELPEGDPFILIGPSTEVLIWRADETREGGYELRTSGADWPWNIPVLTRKHINSGMIVHDVACPEPKDPGP